MAQSIKTYMLHIAKNPKELENYKKNPDAHIEASKLSAEDKEALKSGNPARIRRRMGDAYPPGCIIVC